MIEFMYYTELYYTVYNLFTYALLTYIHTHTHTYTHILLYLGSTGGGLGGSPQVHPAPVTAGHRPQGHRAAY